MRKGTLDRAGCGRGRGKAGTILAVLAVAGFALVSPAPGQDASRAGASTPSVQQQIDKLKEGQDRILRELAEIRKLLESTSDRAETRARPTPATIPTINVYGEPYKGDIRTRVAIMEYSDFDCAFCGTYAREILPAIDENYLKPGKVRYYFRDLPLPEHTNAVFKARLARCAGEQGKFWEMHDCLFSNQTATTWQDLSPLVQKLGLDVTQVQECLSTPKYAENIRRSVVSANRIGLNGTPAFLVGTMTEDGGFFRPAKIFVGAESYAAFKTLLDELLAAPPLPGAGVKSQNATGSGATGGK